MDEEEHRLGNFANVTKVRYWTKLMLGDAPMTNSSVEVDDSEEPNLLICDIADRALEAAATTDAETVGNITWYYCPTGLTICRF